jgi:hypothetical protein
MAAIKCICKTEGKQNHEEIKRKIYFAGGAITREKVHETSRHFSGELEFVSEGGTLYRELKESELVININIVNL